VVITAQSIDNPSLIATATLKILAATPPIRVNCGWYQDFTDAQGRVWSADSGYSPKYPGSSASGDFGNSITGQISGITPDMYPLYSNYRYGWGTLNYTFAVPNGNYSVALKFADPSDTPNGWLFSTAINGQMVLSQFTADSIGTTKVAIDKTFPVTVTNRQIQITFVSVGQQWGEKGYLINGIEILPTQ